LKQTEIEELKEENRSKEEQIQRANIEKLYNDIATNLRNVNRTQKDSQVQISSLLKEKTFLREFSKITDQFKSKTSNNFQEEFPDLASSRNVNQTQNTTTGGKVLKPFNFKILIVLLSMSLFVLTATKTKPD
jgi:hypothetical protein